LKCLVGKISQIKLTQLTMKPYSPLPTT